MTQNRSPAVMAQRVEPHDSLDFFPTPPWATRALCEFLTEQGYELGEATCWEPACGMGDMARPLAEYFGAVLATDVQPYQPATTLCDFLAVGEPAVERCNWIITNPPFRLAAEFAARATHRSLDGAALLVRTAFLEGCDRYRTLFKPNPPSRVLQFCERVPMHKGKLTATGSTATAYCWVIWERPASPEHQWLTDFHWIPPCRKQLERPGDYPSESASHPHSEE